MADSEAKAGKQFRPTHATLEIASKDLLRLARRTAVTEYELQVIHQLCVTTAGGLSVLDRELVRINRHTAELVAAVLTGQPVLPVEAVRAILGSQWAARWRVLQLGHDEYAHMRHQSHEVLARILKDASMTKTTITLSAPDRGRGGNLRQFSGAKLRVLRQAKGWSVTTLAYKTQVGESTIRSWESGLHVPQQRLLDTLARKLGCRPSDFFD